MASIRREITLGASAEDVWDAVRDFGAVHKRVVPGFVVECTLEGETRLVTFSNGTVAREVLVGRDDNQRRLVYAVKSERVSHYNASLQVFPEDEHSRVVWIVDVLPGEVKDYIVRQMEEAAGAMKSTFAR